MNSSSGRVGRPAVLMAALCMALCLGSGCESDQARGAGSARRLTVTVEDFALHLSRSTLPAGPVVLSIRNAGPTRHEVIVVRSDGQGLPFRRDGVTLDEDALQAREVGALEPMKPHRTMALDLRLRSGRYVVFCNMAGHYLAGMSAELKVT